MKSRNDLVSDEAHASCGSWWQSWRLLPLVYLGLGVVILVAQLSADNAASGLLWFGIMAAIAAIYAFGGRFDLIRQARGDLADERDVSINMRAMAATGTVLVVALTGCIVYELARGHNPTPYSTLMAVGGITYIVSLLISRYRF